MKNILFLILLTFCFGKITQAQSQTGNLTYSRVITKTFVLNGTDSSAYDTVPSGKVWKMESIMFNSSSQNINKQTLQINSLDFIIPPTQYSYGSEFIKNTITPIWFKSGDFIRFKTIGASTTNLFYSIIEYNEN